MKYILIIAFLFSTAKAQTKVIQNNDFLYLYNSSTMQVIPSCKGYVCYKTILNGDTLARIYANNIIYWKGTLAAASVSDTLSASGITGVCRITVPSTINTQRVFQIGELAIIFSTSSYRVEYSDANYGLPVKILNGSTLYCTIDESGNIDWNITPQWSWIGRVGTTRIKRITLP